MSNLSAEDTETLDERIDFFGRYFHRGEDRETTEGLVAEAIHQIQENTANSVPNYQNTNGVWDEETSKLRPARLIETLNLAKGMRIRLDCQRLPYREKHTHRIFNVLLRVGNELARRDGAIFMNTHDEFWVQKNKTGQTAILASLADYCLGNRKFLADRHRPHMFRKLNATCGMQLELFLKKNGTRMISPDPANDYYGTVRLTSGIHVFKLACIYYTEMSVLLQELVSEQTMIKNTDRSTGNPAKRPYEVLNAEQEDLVKRAKDEATYLTGYVPKFQTLEQEVQYADATSDSEA